MDPYGTKEKQQTEESEQAYVDLNNGTRPAEYLRVWKMYYRALRSAATLSHTSAAVKPSKNSGLVARYVPNSTHFYVALLAEGFSSVEAHQIIAWDKGTYSETSHSAMIEAGYRASRELDVLNGFQPGPGDYVAPWKVGNKEGRAPLGAKPNGFGGVNYE